MLSSCLFMQMTNGWGYVHFGGCREAFLGVTLLEKPWCPTCGLLMLCVQLFICWTPAIQGAILGANQMCKDKLLGPENRGMNSSVSCYPWGWSDYSSVYLNCNNDSGVNVLPFLCAWAVKIFWQKKKQTKKKQYLKEFHLCIRIAHMNADFQTMASLYHIFC